jgi:peptidoglycan hydrolase CwlO-like protein
VKSGIIIVSFLLAFKTLAAVTVYQEMDNAGLDRFERFSLIEKHLAELGKTINKLESKLDENSKMVKNLEAKFSELKVADSKKTDSKAEEKQVDGKKIEDEMKKLKDDFLSIKNKDIEPMKADIYDLKISQRILEGKLR